MSIRKALLGGAALAVLVAVVVAAGWWLFIREDAQLATSAPEIPEDLVQAPEVPSPDDGTGAAELLTFRIIPDLSEAAYFVDEELASLPLPSTAKGVTSEIEGEFHLTGDGTTLAPGTASQFTVDLRNLKSDESRRDSRVQDALATDMFPDATFTVSDATGYDPTIPEGDEQTLLLAGTLDLHGAQREVTWDVKARRESNVVTGLATITFPFADFDITPPTFAGLVSISDEVTLQVQLVTELV